MEPGVWSIPVKPAAVECWQMRYYVFGRNMQNVVEWLYAQGLIVCFFRLKPAGLFLFQSIKRKQKSLSKLSYPALLIANSARNLDGRPTALAKYW